MEFCMSNSASEQSIDYERNSSSDLIQQANGLLTAALVDLKSGNPLHSSCFDDLIIEDNEVLLRIKNVFNLSQQEVELLLVCVLLQLDGRLANLCCDIINRFQPSLEIASELLNQGRAMVLSPQSPLRHWLMIELQDHTSLQLSPLMIEEGCFFYINGQTAFSDSIQHLLTTVPSTPVLMPNQQAMADQVSKLFELHQQQTNVLHLLGNDQSLLEAVAVAAAQAQQKTLIRVDATRLPNEIKAIYRIVRLLVRDAVLHNRLYLVDARDGHIDMDFFVEQYQLCSDELNSTQALHCFYIGEAPKNASRSGWISLSLRPSTEQEKLIQWQQQLTLRGWEMTHSDIGKISEQFDLTLPAMQSVCDHLLSQSTQAPSFKQWWATCREQCRTTIHSLVKVITPSALSWQDFILPQPEMRILKAIVDQINLRYKVYQQWGMGESKTYGLGISALFAGASGTGKTFAARIIASELDLDIYQIDLSTVMDKYIGETEKKLDAIFTAAESSGAILLFDEADALFGKRSEVKESNDRYANVGVSYLLQRMEQYKGLSLLTTNMRHSLDQAFVRRLRFIVNFPLPKETQRQAIWRLAFPKGLGVEGIDFGRLARLPVGGGTISSIALNAVFFSAGEGENVTMVHVFEATRVEFLKAEKELKAQWVVDWV
jgi:ATPase family associated with various cellular activities (AAA)